MSKKPGVMLYFARIRPFIEQMPAEDFKNLMTAVVDYAEYGRESELTGLAKLCFSVMKPDIDRDSVEYEKKTLKSKYGVYCKKCKARNEEAISFDDWLEVQPDQDMVQPEHILLRSGKPDTITNTDTNADTEPISKAISILLSESYSDSESETEKRLPDEPESRVIHTGCGEFCGKPEDDEEGRGLQAKAMAMLRDYVRNPTPPSPVPTPLHRQATG